MGVDPVSLGAEAAVAAPAIEGASKGAEAAGALAPEIGAGAAAGAPLDILAGGTAAGSAVPLEAGALAGAPSGALASGLATEPAFAGSVGGAFAPGLEGAAGAALPAASAPTVGPSNPFIGGGAPISPGTGSGPFQSAFQGGPADTILPDSATITSGTGPASGSASGFSLDGQPVGANEVTLGPSGGGSGGAGDFFSNNKNLLTLLGLGVGGQLLSPEISKALGLNKVPGSENLNALAQQEAGLASSQAKYGTALQQPLITGVLPPGQQQAVTNAVNDAITTIKGRYGALGLSGSSMEAEAIANVKNRSVEIAGKLEQEMAQTGQAAISSATANLGLESNIYDTLLNATIQQDQQLGNAISRFATAVGTGSAIKGGQGGITGIG